MKYEELYSMSRGELFEKLKSMSKTKAWWQLCLAVGLLLFGIVATISWQNEEVDQVLICLFSVCCIAAGWIAVNNLRFLWGLNSHDSPEQLLYWYEKRHNSDRKAVYLAMIGLIICDPILYYDIINLDRVWIMMELTFNVAIIALLIYSYFNDDIMGDYKTRRDEEIFDGLEELAEKK